MLYIIHQVNCQGAFGAGFAGYIAKHLPQAREDYIEWSKLMTIHAPRKSLLGRYCISKFDRFAIVHVFSQEYYGNSKKTGVCYTNYNALNTALHDIRLELDSNATIICPQYIGCGLAGGDWPTVKSILERYNITPCSNINLERRTYRVAK